MLVDQKNICVQRREVWDQTYEINIGGNFINEPVASQQKVQ